MMRIPPLRRCTGSGLFDVRARMILGVLILLATTSPPAKAIITYGGTGQYLVPGTGPITTSGFQFEGQWQNTFLGTAIAPNDFITAGHLGGNVGDSFIYNGATYTTTARFNDPSAADVTIWKVNGSFGSYAPIYTGGNEVGQSLVVYGDSGARGAPVMVNGTSYGGWYFTPASAVTSYGTNVISTAGTVAGAPTGQYLTFQFNPALGATTASLAPGDSGGGVFLQQGGVWSLAGINFAVDGPYNVHAVNDPNYKASDAFNGAIYNQSGLFYDGTNTPLGATFASSYASRLSTEVAWIESVTGLTSVPEPTGLVLLLSGLGLAVPVWLRRRGRSMPDAT